MQLLLDSHRALLLSNGRRSAAGEDIDPHPVVKLFTPDAGASWLLTEVDPDDPDIAFGLCDPGLGCPELGTVRISEIETLRGRFRLPVERDLYFEAHGPLSAYVVAARRAQRIVTETHLIAARRPPRVSAHAPVDPRAAAHRPVAARPLGRTR